MEEWYPAEEYDECDGEYISYDEHWYPERAEAYYIGDEEDYEDEGVASNPPMIPPQENVKPDLQVVATIQENMKDVVVLYVKKGCPFCDEAIEFLQSKNMEYDAIDDEKIVKVFFSCQSSI